MKRILIALTLVTVLGINMVACGSSNEQSNKESNSTTTTQNSDDNEKEKTKEDIKAKAVEANYNDIISGKQLNENVWVEGEIETIDNSTFPDFDLKVKSGDNFVTYKILNTESLEGLKAGDKVKVYGTVSDSKENTKIPTVEANTIDKE